MRASAVKVLGEDNITERDLPRYAAEDFCYFLQKKPGCYFLMGIRKPGQQPFMAHTSTFNYNDDVSPIGG